MAVAKLVGVLCVLACAQAAVLVGEPAIIEDLRNGDASTRIVAGWPAEEGQIPFQGSLRMVSNIGGVSSCGCSLLHHNWVMTAAHCVANRDMFVLRFGLTNLTRPELLIESDRKYIHPGYIEASGGVQPNDLALIGLDYYVSYTANIQPIRMQSSAQKNINYSGVLLTVSGFGRTDDLWNGGAASEILLWTRQRGLSYEQCRAWYVNSQALVESSICAEADDNPSQSSCQGDSGGPLVVVDEDSKPTMVGIVSYGSSAGCNSPWPTVYVRPGHYHEWYLEITGIDFDWTFEAESDPEPDSDSKVKVVNSI